LAPPTQPFALEGAERFVWRPATRRLEPVSLGRAVPLALLKGVEDQRDALLANTEAFAAGRAANHALLWGARGTGKSALVKAVAAAVAGVKLVEVPATALADAPALVETLAGSQCRVILYLDDLALEPGEAALRALKPALDGGLSAGKENVVIYATANRRHIVGGARSDARSDPTAADTEQERLSLSDRFGLWLGFHPVDQATYLEIVFSYAAHFGLADDPETLRAEALSWAMGRGARSGRTAWQFITARRAVAQG
jgi:predicted AAA+ superfamily ATPase